MYRAFWRDPAVVHVGEVMHAWAMCVETSLPSLSVLDAVLEQSRGILQSRAPWGQCSNPAHVLHLSGRRKTRVRRDSSSTEEVRRAPIRRQRSVVLEYDGRGPSYSSPGVLESYVSPIKSEEAKST